MRPTRRWRALRSSCLAIGLLGAFAAPAHAGYVTVEGGELRYIDYGYEDNNVTITDFPTHVTIADTSGIEDITNANCVRANPFAVQCNYRAPVPTFRTITVAVGNLSDSVRYRASGPGAGFDLTRTSDAQGNDIIDGSAGRDLILSGPGNDVYRLNAGPDQVYAAQAVSFPTFRGFAAGAGNDLIYGGSGNDVMNGGSGNDRLYGQAGNDRLRGNLGFDRLVGGLGIDILDGRPGEARTG